MTTAPFPRMHVSLYVKDLTKTLAFYEQFFGQAPEKVKPQYAKFLFNSPALVISFVENPERVQENFGHLGIQVETLEEVNAWQARLETLDLPIVEEKDVSCCYAIQDKFWATDPDGVQWEVYLFREDATFNDPKYASGGDGEACCVPASQPKQKMRWNHQAQAAEASCEPDSGCC